MEGAHGSLLDRGSGLRFRLSRGSRQDNAPPPRLPKDVNVQIFETHEFAALHGKGDFAARMDLEVRELSQITGYAQGHLTEARRSQKRGDRG